MTTETKKRDLKSKLLDRLHDPLQLRIVVFAGLLGCWYFLGYSPMTKQIDNTTKMLELDRKRLALAVEVDQLRNEAAVFADRLPPRSDPNEFLQYILGGVRKGALKLVSLAPEKSKEAGPYEVATVKLELEGKYKDVDALLYWVENDTRMLRIDTIKLDPDTRDPTSLRLQIAVVGLMGAEAADKAASKGEPNAKPSNKSRNAAGETTRNATPASPKDKPSSTTRTPPRAGSEPSKPTPSASTTKHD